MRGCRPLEKDEVSTIMTSFSGSYAKRDRALFVLGIRTGFRISELLSLRIENVIQNDRIVDRVSVARRHMKKRVEGRTILLHPEAKAFLAEWLDEMGASDLPATTFVFLSRKGENNPVSRVHAWRVLNQTFEATGVSGKTGTHSMRKTFAARVYEALGHDLVKMQRALGHRNINSTAAYLSFAEEEIDQAVLAA